MEHVAIRASRSTFSQESSMISENFAHFNLRMSFVLSTFVKVCSGKGFILIEKG
jgi:hypothetical protein